MEKDVGVFNKDGSSTIAKLLGCKASQQHEDNAFL